MDGQSRGKVISFEAYRAANPRPQPLLPFGPARAAATAMTPGRAGHRARMLQHLTAELRSLQSGTTRKIAEIGTIATN